jgi:hypothetical protein
MTIGIVTLYNYFNFGAFLQALAMQNAVEALGGQPQFVNLRTPQFLYRRWRMIAYRTFATCDPKKMFFNTQRLGAYEEAFAMLKVAPRPYATDPMSYEAVVIGSDEVWNVKNPAFHCAPQFFGNDIEADRIVSYAPSCGQATYKDLAEYPGAREGLSKMFAVSGRDQNTVDTVARLTGRTPAKVLDPTFISDLRSYEQPVDERGYILVYTYRFKKDEVEKTREFARRCGKKLLSAGFYQDWCDRSLLVSPMQFLSLIKNADHVITNTFHGTVFSILYGKSLAVFAANKQKVLDLLAELRLLRHNASAVQALHSVVDQEIDWARVGSILAQARERSLLYLRRTLAEKADSPVSAEARAAV